MRPEATLDLDAVDLLSGDWGRACLYVSLRSCAEAGWRGLYVSFHGQAAEVWVRQERGLKLLWELWGSDAQLMEWHALALAKLGQLRQAHYQGREQLLQVSLLETEVDRRLCVTGLPQLQRLG